MSRAFICQGIGFGDEGKGTITDFLTRRFNSRLTVRYNGGSQASHAVVTSSGQDHRFSQFGSGTFAGARTLLSEHMLVNPLGMMEEAADLENKDVSSPLDWMFVDENAIVITPYHIALNRLRELARGANAHGTCGHGVGECRRDSIENPVSALIVGDLKNRATTVLKLSHARSRLLALAEEFDFFHVDINEEIGAGVGFRLDPQKLVDAYSSWTRTVAVLTSAEVADLINAQETIVFEGAQGVLLDQDYGFHPYTTWSDCTMANADAILAKVGHGGQKTKIGVMRIYMTRHGAGPFVTEDAELTRTLIDKHNGNNGPQGAFRCGWLDLAALQYALAVNGPVDGLAVTHCDVIEKRNGWKVIPYYQDQQHGINWKPAIANKLPRIVEQEHLTKRLLRSTSGNPSFKDPQNVAGILDLIGRELQTPILITSHGPTAEDKQFHQEFASA